MQIYKNGRTWPTRLMLWLTAGGTVVALAYALYGHLSGNGDATLGLIFAGLLAFAALMLEAIARHVVTAIHVNDASIAVDTLSLFGDRRRMLSEASVGDERQTYRMDSPDFESPLEVLASVADLLGSRTEAEVDSRWRPFRVPGKRIPLLLDVTADPASGEQIVQAVAAASKR